MRIELTQAKFNATTLRFAEKFDHLFSHVFTFSNMFPESHGFISVPVTISNNFVSFTNEIGIGTQFLYCINNMFFKR